MDSLNNSKKNDHRVSLVTISKRTDASLSRGIIVRAIAIVLALIVCGVVTVLLTGDDPLSVYATIVNGAVGSSFNAWVTAQNVAILLCISLAVTPAFRMRFWNIGAEGQTLMGALATAVCMITLGGKLPDPILIPVMLIVALVAGAVWGLLPAVFKAYWNTNETLFTLMMNYVAIQLIEYFLKVADKSGSNTVGPKLLCYGHIPSLFGQNYLLNIIVVAVLTVIVYIYLNYSKHGYEISVVGESQNTARYIGINVKKVIVRTMIVSGAICGLAGFLLVAGTSHSIDVNLAGGRGFTAIMVSWLAKFNPIIMILTSFLLVFLGRGAEAVTTKFGLNASFSDILTGIILFFIIGSEFFINYRITLNFRKNAKEDHN